MSSTQKRHAIIRDHLNYYHIYYHIIILLSHHKSLLSISTMDSVSLQTRISDAKTFLLENPDERTACAAQIFKIRPTTLYSSIATDKKSSFSDMKSFSNKKSSSSAKSARGGQNKILEEHQVKAIHHFIRSLLAQGIKPSHGVVFNAIVNLKRGKILSRVDLLYAGSEHGGKRITYTRSRLSH